MLKRKGDNNCHLLTADLTPGTGLRSFETPTPRLVHLTAPPRGSRRSDPTSRLAESLAAEGCCAHLPPVPDASTHMWLLHPCPLVRSPAASVSLLTTKGRGWGCPSCSSLTSVHAI